jgi:hypothetical protein
MKTWLNSNLSYREFVRQGKNQPGTLIEVFFNNRRNQFLIGDVNTACCVDEGKKPFGEDAIITRYKVLWSR